MATLPGGSFPHCEYAGPDARGWVTVEGLALSPYASLAVYVPARTGRYACVGDPHSGILITYVNAQALTYTARASDGKDTEHSGTCTVNVTMVTDRDFTGSVEATVVNGGEGDNPKPYRVFATWDVHNCLRGGCLNR